MSGKEGCSPDQKAFRKQGREKDRNKGRNKNRNRKCNKDGNKKAETKNRNKGRKEKVLKRTGKKECNMLSEAMERFIKEHEKRHTDLLLTIAKIPSHPIMREKEPSFAVTG